MDSNNVILILVLQEFEVLLVFDTNEIFMKNYRFSTLCSVKMEAADLNQARP
jgi:hypothetical protein